MTSGGNTYLDCAGVGQRVRIIYAIADRIGPDRVGSNGVGVCAVCGRRVSQRGGVASRHADKRSES